RRAPARLPRRCAALGGPAVASAGCLGAAPSVSPVTPKPGGRALAFGIYPGGPAGQVVVPAPSVPDDHTKILAALDRLRPVDGPFTLHLYRSYSSDSTDAKEEVEQRRLVDLYTSRGYGVEIVLRYR